MNYTVNGTTYLVTNEGDEKDYSGFSERTVVGASDYNLDPPFIQMLGFKNNRTTWKNELPMLGNTDVGCRF
jgi:hypothetical protein